MRENGARIQNFQTMLAGLPDARRTAEKQQMQVDELQSLATAADEVNKASLALRDALRRFERHAARIHELEHQMGGGDRRIVFQSVGSEACPVAFCDGALWQVQSIDALRRDQRFRVEHPELKQQFLEG